MMTRSSKAKTWMKMTILNETHLILPDWPAPPNVRAIQTTREGGVSDGPYASLNLGDHVGDDAMRVSANRQRLSAFLPSEPIWMRQVHGVEVICADEASCQPQADAAISRAPNAVSVVMTADCLPLLLCDRAGTVVAAVHAGWRGLLAGVIETTVARMKVAPMDILAWLGPAIGPDAFEVGNEVRDAFMQQDPRSEQAFRPKGNGKWMADLYLLARMRLKSLGVPSTYGGDLCTYQDARRFFSYRRDGVTGRMATLIWLAK